MSASKCVSIRWPEWKQIFERLVGSTRLLLSPHARRGLEAKAREVRGVPSPCRNQGTEPRLQ